MHRDACDGSYERQIMRRARIRLKWISQVVKSFVQGQNNSHIGFQYRVISPMVLSFTRYFNTRYLILDNREDCPRDTKSLYSIHCTLSHELQSRKLQTCLKSSIHYQKPPDVLSMLHQRLCLLWQSHGSSCPIHKFLFHF